MYKGERENERDGGGREGGERFKNLRYWYMYMYVYIHVHGTIYIFVFIYMYNVMYGRVRRGG